MKTTIRVSLNGVAFNLDENAYAQLKSYLDEVQQHFGANSEVSSDIEARFADLLSMRVKSSEQAVNVETVNEIIGIIGKPTDIDGDGTISKEEYYKHFENTNAPVRKRLYRDTDNKVIAGVCSGLGHYLNMSEVWIRLAFVIFALVSFNAFGWNFPYINHFFSHIFHGAAPFVVIVYVVLWIVMPEAKTTRQTLEMHGYEPNPSVGGEKTASHENGFWAFVKGFFRVIIKICVIFTLSILIIVCGALLLTGFVGFFGGTLFGGGENVISILDYVNIGSHTFLAKLMLALVIFIPLCLIVYYSIKFLVGWRHNDKPMLFVCLIVWFLALLFVGGNIATRFSNKHTYSHKKIVALNKNIKTLNVKLPETLEACKFSGININDNILYRNVDGEDALYVCPEIHVRRVDTVTDCRIEVSKFAFGNNQKDARRAAEILPNGFVQTDSVTITLQPMRFDKQNKWSFENIDVYVYVTDSTEVHVDDEIWD